MTTLANVRNHGPTITATGRAAARLDSGSIVKGAQHTSPLHRIFGKSHRGLNLARR